MASVLAYLVTDISCTLKLLISLVTIHSVTNTVIAVNYNHIKISFRGLRIKASEVAYFTMAVSYAPKLFIA